MAGIVTESLCINNSCQSGFSVFLEAFTCTLCEVTVHRGLGTALKPILAGGHSLFPTLSLMVMCLRSGHLVSG